MAEYAPITEEHGWFTGQDFTIGFTVEGEGPLTGDFEWFFRSNETESEALIHKTATILDADDRTISVEIAADDTRDLAPMTGAHALKRVTTGQERPLAYGPAVLQQAASH